MHKRMVVVVLAIAGLLAFLLWMRETVPTRAADPNVIAATSTAADAAAVSSVAADAASVQRTVADVVSSSLADPELELAGDLNVLVVYADGEKAPAVNVYLARCLPGASRMLAELVSDEHGRASARLPAGPVRITSDRFDRDAADVEVEIVAGKKHEVRLELPAGVDVEGVVRDGAGAPVPRARIWLTSHQVPWCAGAFVTAADASGTFRLRAVPEDQSLGAVAPGFAPSRLVDLDLLDRQQTPVHVDLVLAEPGGALVGRVVDEHGQAVAEAIVAVGGAESLLSRRSLGSMEELWAPRRSVAGADGGYAIDGLAPGKHRVEVWSRAFPVWSGEVPIAANGTARLDIVLLCGVTVHGVVTGQDGQRLAGAVVHAFPIAVDAMLVQRGVANYQSTFGHPFTVADAVGRFRLLRVAPGELHLHAGTDGGRRMADATAWASEVLHAQPGAVLEWNPTIDSGPTIRGVVRYRDGAPMAGVLVSAVEPGTSRGPVAETDAHGCFQLLRLQKKAYDVSVRGETAPNGAAPLEAREVWPDTGELELRASFDAPRKETKGAVSGFVSDAAGRLANAATLQVILATDRGDRGPPRFEGSSFRFGNVDPGRMRLVVLSGSDPILFGPWFELQPAEDRDVGTLATEPGGSLRLRIVRHAGAETLAPVVHITPVGAPRGRKVEVGRTTEVVIDNLCAGESRLSVDGEGLSSVGCTCVVIAGTEIPAAIELRAAVERAIVVEYTAAQRLTRVRVQDERGDGVFDAELGGVLPRPLRTRSRLPIGRFRCLVETAGGGKAQVEFEMTSLAEGQPPVVVVAK